MLITHLCFFILTCFLATLPISGADVSSNAGQIFDKQLDAIEGEVLAVVKTMPSSKFQFVPRMDKKLMRHARST